MVDTSLQNNKMLNWPILKAFAHNKMNLTKKLKFALRKVENIVGKRENAGNQHFLLSVRFQKPPHSGLLKVGDCVVKKYCIL